jgi:type IV pilus assembly protein PilM
VARGLAIGPRVGGTSVGLDIGTTAVRLVQVGTHRGQPRVQRSGEVGLPQGAVREGEVADVEAVAAAIKTLWAQVKPSSKRVHLGLANRRVVIRQVDLPWLPLDELRASLPFQAQDLLPMPVETALLDFWPLEEVTTPSGVRLQRGLLVAAARETAEKTVAAVQRAGLVPVSLDILPLALIRALASWAPDAVADDAPVEALVDVGADVTNIVVHRLGQPLFVRTLLLGGSAATEAVASSLGISFEEAEHLKRSADLLAPQAAETVTVLAALEEPVEMLAREIAGSLQYYRATSSSTGPVQRLLLTGGGARLRGLTTALAYAGLPVEVADPFAALSPSLTRSAADSDRGPLSAVPVGLALGSAR